MAKTVLLARPHPFIVSEMKPFLEQGGFAVKKSEGFSGLSSSVAGISGAIISLAVTSSVTGTPEAVFAEIRRVAPRAPVLFAAMLDFAKMRDELERLSKSSGIEATILGVDPVSEGHPALGKPNTFLYLSKDDLTVPERRVIAAKVVQRHFR